MYPKPYSFYLRGTISLWGTRNKEYSILGLPNILHRCSSSEGLVDSLHGTLNPKPSVLPPLSNSWIIVIIWLYIAFNGTPNIDCYWVGAVPNLNPNYVHLLGSLPCKDPKWDRGHDKFSGAGLPDCGEFL